MRCPAGGCELHPFETTAGLVLRCQRGHGTSINLAVLRRRFDETVALWRAASRQPQGSRACPSCARPMRAFFWQAEQHIELDACSTCQLVWFDAAEIEALRIRLVERVPTVPHAGRLPLGAEISAGPPRESGGLLQHAETALDALDLLSLLEFFDL